MKNQNQMNQNSMNQNQNQNQNQNKESEVVTMKNANVIALSPAHAAIANCFPKVAHAAIIRAQGAKNPLSTKLGQAILGNSFALLQVFAAGNNEALPALAACVNMINVLHNNHIRTPEAIGLYAWKYCITAHINKGDFATISLSSWKKVLKQGMPALTYNAPKGEYTVVGLDSIVFNAPAIKGGDVLSCRMREMTPAEKLQQAARMREKIERELTKIAALEAAARAEQGEQGE